MSRRLSVVALSFVCLLLSLSPLSAYAFSDGQGASIALGQPNFTSYYSATSQTGLMSFGYNPQYSGVTVGPKGNVWVVDSGNNRVLEFASPWVNGEKASLVLGQPDFTSSGSATTMQGMNDPRGVAIDKSGNVWVADSGNNRVLEFLNNHGFTKGGFTNGEAASVVIGQSGFTSSAAATTQTGLRFPTGVAIGPGGSLWVADYKNNRVLEFTAPFSNGEKAFLALGQDGYKSSEANTNQYGMSGPYGIAVDPKGNVWVADSGNNRVVEFNSKHVQNEVESIELGQTGFNDNSYSTSNTAMNVPLAWRSTRTATYGWPIRAITESWSF
jgi:sugar lactone lactonase YvrE